MSNTAYMCKNRHGMYYARFIIPKHLQSHFNNKKEIRRTLQTDSRKLAIKRARVYRVEFEKIVDELMANKLMRTGLITFIDLNANPVTIDTGNHDKDLELYNSMKPVESEQARITREKRSNELHQAQLKAITSSVQFTAPAPTINPKLLSEYLVDYIKHQTDPNRLKLKQGWIGSTRETNELTLNNFITYCDKPAAAFNKEDAERYFEILRKIPKQFNNADHSKKLKDDLTIEKMLDDNFDPSSYETLAPSTMRTYISTIAAFFTWAVEYKDIESLQPAIKILKLTKKKLSSKSNRRHFSEAELKTLFEDDNPAKENYVKGFKSKNSKRLVEPHLKYWMPLLSLYTGATIAELCQLHLSDIRKHNARDGSEHWIIDFQEHMDDIESRLKTDYRPRLIPVHNILLNLGFVDYTQDLVEKGEIELFPTAKRRNIPKHEDEAEQGKADFAAESRWWATYSGKAGVKDKNVVFHSFRHNVNTFLDGDHIPDELLNAIGGHTSNVMGKTVYSKGGHRAKDIAPLVVAINKIDYGLNHHPFKLAP